MIERKMPLPVGMREIYLAGGCFWGMEKYAHGLYGVIHTTVGYANGQTESPSYRQVCTGRTGYAETVQVYYHPLRLPLPFLLKLFLEAIDPTSVNRQGHDVGTQYRPGIYFTDETDRETVCHVLDEVAKAYDKPLAVEAMPLTNYYLAEAEHQDYLRVNPDGYCHLSDEVCKRAQARRAYAKPDDDTLKTCLTPEQYAVTQQNATEAPFSNAYHDNARPGLYVDITTGEPLFLSIDQFASGCGWPAFSKPIDADLLRELPDHTLTRPRVEVRSRTGDAHLGHVFTDGPAERGGLRYCINSASLKFIPLEELEKEGYGDWRRVVAGD